MKFIEHLYTVTFWADKEEVRQSRPTASIWAATDDGAAMLVADQFKTDIEEAHHINVLKTDRQRLPWEESDQP